MKKDKEESCSSSEEAVVVITSNYSNLHPCSLLQCLFRACFGCLGSLDDTTDKVHHHLSLSLSLSLSLTHTHTHTLKSNVFCMFTSLMQQQERDGSRIEAAADGRRPPRPRPDPGPDGQINVVQF